MEVKKASLFESLVVAKLTCKHDNVYDLDIK